ncbi:hypothetical protein KGF56_002558 [Candida oxycetoniae]|uniref:Inner centromere protein ARK-binding domain-containing protein n=1 Tax=Candida oxycetoniae TaxID=497107 RepID=A0AAI9SWZ9_9ASCO|nr:uncharacterized protein KGF56_002558 [Candida oxycetoniae]KAI3404662.2 hypothetical protein KGF56_002558 [Candida oxycetoniae]
MSSWVIRATKRTDNEVVPGSSRYVATELDYQLTETAFQIGEHYGELYHQLDRLGSMTRDILNGTFHLEDGDATAKQMNETGKQSKRLKKVPRDESETSNLPRTGPILEKPILEKPILEKPILKKPILEKPILEKPILEKPILEKPILPHAEPILPLCESIPEKVLPFVTPKTPAKVSINLDNSFEAISTAIRKSTALRNRLAVNPEVIAKTPNTRSSIFVSFPHRESLLSRHSKVASDIHGSGNKAFPSSKDESSTDLDRNVDVDLSYKEQVSIQSSPEKLQLFTSNAPSRNITTDLQPTITAWEKIITLRSLSPKRSTLSPKRSPIRSSRSRSRSPIRIKDSPLKSPHNQSLYRTKSEAILERLTSPTASTAAKSVKKVEKKIQGNRFLTTSLQRKRDDDSRANYQRLAEPVVPKHKYPLPNSTKKSMMEKRSEAAALKQRQKIVVKVREASQVRGRSLPVTHTPQKVTPEHLPFIPSDDDKDGYSRVVKPWGNSPEIRKLVDAGNNADPSKIFPSRPGVDLSKVFNKTYKQSPMQER